MRCEGLLGLTCILEAAGWATLLTAVVDREGTAYVGGEERDSMCQR